MQPDALSKDNAIADAGLSRRSAYDYEALAGGRDERAQAAGKAASEHYYAHNTPSPNRTFPAVPL